jgi:hypothetical protein
MNADALDLAGLSELFREPRVAATTKPERTKMGVDLMGLGGCSFNWRAWQTLHDLGLAFGWRPAGTLPMTGQTDEGDVDLS